MRLTSSTTKHIPLRISLTQWWSVIWLECTRDVAPINSWLFASRLPIKPKQNNETAHSTKQLVEHMTWIMTTYKTDRVHHLPHWTGAVSLFLFRLHVLEAALAHTIRIWQTALVQKGKCWISTQVDFNYKNLTFECCAFHKNCFLNTSEGSHHTSTNHSWTNFNFKLATFRLNKQSKRRRTAANIKDGFGAQRSLLNPRDEIFYSILLEIIYEIHLYQWVNESYEVANSNFSVFQVM